MRTIKVQYDDLKFAILETIEEAGSGSYADMHHQGFINLYGRVVEDEIFQFHTFTHGEIRDDNYISLFRQEWFNPLHDADYDDSYDPKEQEYATWQEMQENAPHDFAELVSIWQEGELHDHLYNVRVDYIHEIIDYIDKDLYRQGINLEFIESKNISTMERG